MSGPRPNFSFTRSSSRATLSEYATSHSTANASVPNSSAISFATFSICSRVRAATATFAPSRASAKAMARPMPRPPPVIRAKRLLSFMKVQVSGFRLRVAALSLKPETLDLKLILVPRESWRALFEKRPHAFLAVSRFEATELRLYFITQHRVQIFMAAQIDCLFGRRDRSRRRIAQALSQFARLRFEFVFGYDPVHETQSQSLRRVYSVAEKEKLASLVRSHKPG